MGKKRQNEDKAEQHVPAKKDKFAEFNGTVFKTMLKEPTQAMKGLEKFISTAKKLPSPDLYDVVEGYIKISMDCTEIFRLLEGEAQVESELMLIFESLEMILLRTASDLSHFNTVGNAIVKKTVSSHMKSLLGSLHSNNHRFVRQCLNFLSALVAQGPEAAREVLSHIYAYKTMSGLAKRRDKQGKPDVRMAYIQFVLSFLVSGDNTTVGQILEVKEFLPEILNTGLKEDRLSVVNLILTTLKSRVVLNKGMSKTQKVRFFTPAVLANLASLYKWNGIVDAATEEESMEESPQSGASVVRAQVHSFLVDLCCSRKHGISFHDASFGTAGRVGNLVLLQFLVGLKQAPEDELVAELLVKVLKASPDILSRYFKETQHSYSPRLKNAWQDNVSLMKKIYEAQPDVSTILQSQEAVPSSRLLSMIHVLSLPPVCNKAFFTQGLNLPNTAVQLTTFSVMNFILKRAHKNMAHLQERAACSPADGPSADVAADLLQLYRESLTKILPDMTTVVGKWQALSKKEKVASDATNAKNEKSTEDTGEKAGQETAEVILLKALILQVICLYQKVVPHLVGQCKFDFSKLLRGILSEQGIKEGVPPMLQDHILQLALELPSCKFSWFRLECGDAADSESSSSEKSVLYQILNMFVSSSTSHLKTSTRKLVLKVLKDSGVFEYTWTELELWLDQLCALQPSQRETVIHFLEKVLVKLVSSSHVYTDKVASLVQEAAYVQANLSGQEGDAASIPVSHIDDVLDMLDVIMESSDGDMEEFGPPLSEELIVQTFPFSALVPAALEARNKLSPGKDEVFEYLSSVLSQVLHCQRDPLPLCLALLQYDKELMTPQPALQPDPQPNPQPLHQYYSKWLPQQSHEPLFKSVLVKDLQAPATFSALLKEAYVQGAAALTKDAFVDKAQAALSSAEFPVAIKQVLLYIKTTVEDFDSFPKDEGNAALTNLLRILQLLVVWLLETDDTARSELLAEGSELFLHIEQSSEEEASREQVIISGLSSVLKHPCAQQWFLALERAAFPPHHLKPVRLKQLCSLMSEHVQSLLALASPTLQNLHRLDLLKHFTDATAKAVLKELTEINATNATQQTNGESRAMQALTSLFHYMDFSDVKDVVSKLLLLPRRLLFTTGEEGTGLSVYGRAALQILTQNASPESVFLTQAHLSGLGTLLSSGPSPALEDFFLQILSSEPGSAKLIHTSVLLHCLGQKRGKGGQKIAGLLLRNCSTHRLRFEKWCLESGNAEQLVQDMDTFHSLINVYLELAGKEDPARPEDVREQVLNTLKRSLLPKVSQRVLENLPESSGVEYVETLCSLIKLSADTKDIKALSTKLPAALRTADCLERWRLVDVISEKLAENLEESESWRKCVLSAALVCLKASYSQFKDPEASRSQQEQSVLDTLHTRLTSAGDISASEWNSFVKTGLKCRYKHAAFLSSLPGLVQVMYAQAEAHTDLLPLATLHMMSSSHSMFLPCMLDASEEQTGAHAKEALVSLLLCLVRKCPSVCDMNHFVVLLGAYGASLTTLDQKLLLLIQEYERNNVSLLKFQSFVWGPAAVEHHKAKKSLGSSLWKQSSTEELLALLSPDTMTQSITHFPQQRRLVPQDDEPFFQTDDAKDPQTLYDPRFLLPLFSAVLGPESVIDCLKFVSCHALGFTAAALSSYDPKMRAAAYHVLTRFYHHLEGARFKEKKQLLYLVDLLKNSVRQQNQRLPFILTTFMSKAMQQMLRPEDHMYIVLNRFLLSHQSLDFRRVPEFFKLFYGFELEHKLERDWILNVLEEGISDRYCYELCEQQGVFQSVLGFCSSPLCDEGTQAQILRVLCHAAKATHAAYNLTKSCGLLSWIIQLLDKRKCDQQQLGAIIELVHSLWRTNLGQKEKQLDRLGSVPPEEKAVKCLPFPLTCEFVCVASTITKHLRSGVKAGHLSLFLQTYSSVLKHYVASMDTSAQAERFTLLPEPLSCSEALSLLLCWASLHRHSQLLQQLHSLCLKHQLKHLLPTVKDKNRGKAPGPQTPGPQAPPQSAPPSAEDHPPDASPLPLCAVLCHWTPVFSLPQGQTPRPGDKTEPGALAKDTALLLMRWSLQSLLEGPHTPQHTADFLHWLERAVTEHGHVADALLLDAQFKADFLRLHHRAFQFQSLTEMSLLKSLTKITTRLVEVQGQTPAWHRAVVSACLSGEAGERSRHDAGLFLFSLYIHELWSGVPSAQLFMTHVRLVTDDAQKKKGPALSQSPLRTICNHIITSTKE
ncbi:nucleolar pre-ribosomal-associated protein 1 [Eucyclogobius newberryi]|uniref:nucleolar pre-ribosomal-associated protein 1 n=1 Tax=Eucyclogobius newberryi TaxID=166745 RepID=UPI003B5A9D7C